MRRVALALVVFVAAALTSDARASAPPGQYNFFNRYDVVVQDTKTSLTWQRDIGPLQTFSQAASYCAGLTLPSTSPWRVPSYKELLTLVDENPHISYATGVGVSVAIDPNAFPNTPVATQHWSSSLSAQGNEAYFVDFSDGSASTSPTSATLYVRCVTP